MISVIKFYVIINLAALCWSDDVNSELSKVKPGYKFEYYVKDERTGDFKTQEERREGDYVRGSYSVGEPNGDLRVVTYNADHKTGFNAHVQIQPGGSPLNSSIKDKEKHLEEIMKIMPKYQQRSGFPQIDIKVIPPTLTLTSPTTTSATDVNAKENIKLIDSLMPERRATTVSTSLEIKDDNTTFEDAIKNQTETISDAQDNITTSPTLKALNNNKVDLCKTLFNTKLINSEEEGRAHIKPNEDKVQVEIEQVIRAEMQDPTGINLGIPYQKYDEKKFLLKPLLNEEIIMNEDNLRKETLLANSNTNNGQTPPYLYENVYMYPPLPYSMHNDNTWSRIRYPELSRALFTHSLGVSHQRRPSKISRPLYTTGLAFIVLPRP